eukprot:scaffold308440_cov39-Prasinocladus_malaysianus.AAC.1
MASAVQPDDMNRNDNMDSPDLNYQYYNGDPITPNAKRARSSSPSPNATEKKESVPTAAATTKNTEKAPAATGEKMEKAPAAKGDEAPASGDESPSLSGSSAAGSDLVMNPPNQPSDPLPVAAANAE